MTTSNDAGDPATIPLDRLIPNPDYQPRTGGLSEAHVRLLMESDPAIWPPLLVSPADDGRFNILDGFHRHEAARRLGLPALPCVVQSGAGYPEAVAANLRHGLPLALEDRKDYARWLAAHEPGLSYREIGRRCGLSHKTAKAAVERRGGESPQRKSSPRPPERRIGLADAVESLFMLAPDNGSAGALRATIASYHEDDQPDVAESLAAWGRIFLTVSGDYPRDEGGG